MKTAILIPSSKASVVPPSLALLAKVNKTTPNIQKLNGNIDQEWNQDLHQTSATACLAGRVINLPLHIQQSIILLLLYLRCSTMCNGSERQRLFPDSQIYDSVC